MSEHAQNLAPSLDLSSVKAHWLLLGLGLATGMEFYTFDAMNLVLVDLAGTLGVSFDEASWLLTIYSSTLFLGVPICIWVAGHFGYKRYLMATTLLYATASLGCMVSPNLETMLVFRAVQGFAGAGLVVWWRAAIYVLFPKPQRSPSLMRVSIMLYLSSATGLLLGGAITDHLSWRLMFLPAVPYTAGALWLISKYFPDLPKPTAPRVIESDWLGILLLAISLISLQIVLNRGHIDDWLDSPRIRLLCWMSFASFIGFIWWQTSPRNRYPLLWLNLLRDRRVVSAACIGVFTGMILSGSLYVLPEYLRRAALPRLNATQAAEVMCIYALTAAIIRQPVVHVIAHLGQRKAIVGALIALIISMLVFARILTATTPAFYYALPLMLYAFCLSPLLPAVGSGTVAKIEQNKLLDGVSLYMTFRQLGASLGVALLTILIDVRETLHSSRLFQHLDSAAPADAAWLSGVADIARLRSGVGLHDAGSIAVGLLHEFGVQQSETLANADAFLFMAAIGGMALLLIPIIPPTPAAT